MTYTVKQIQERYGISQHSVLYLISTNQLKAINVGRDPGKLKPRWRITEQALREFEEARAASPPPPKPTRRRREQTDVIEFIK